VTAIGRCSSLLWCTLELTETSSTADKIVDVLGNDMSRALRLAASVQRAFPCPDPLVMTLAAKVFGACSSFEAFEKRD
jgi:hypothetical protein